MLRSLLCSFAYTEAAPAGVPLSPPPPPNVRNVRIALANDPAYALVPQDAPVLLPLSITFETNVDSGRLDFPIRETVSLTVEGDPTGAVTAYSEVNRTLGELTWTPGAAREPGRTYIATLARGVAGGPQELAQAYYAESTFEFSYLDGTSATFLPDVELTLSDISESSGGPGGCCEVDAALCAEASSCFQCWDQAAVLFFYSAWTGPGLPYLSLETEPTGTATVKAFGESCVQGTASGAGETRNFSVCHTVTEWPSVDVPGRHTVFADTCKVMPEGYFPLTRLLVVRAETRTQALQALSSEPKEPPVASRDVPDSDSSVSRCSVGSRPAPGSALAWLAALAVLGAAAHRRQSSCRDSGR